MRRYFRRRKLSNKRQYQLDMATYHETSSVICLVGISEILKNGYPDDSSLRAVTDQFEAARQHLDSSRKFYKLFNSKQRRITEKSK